MDSPGRYNFKVCVVGDWSVGKTSLIQKFAHDVFIKDYKPTMGTDIVVKDLYLDDGSSVNFMIWDIAGQQKWENVRKRYYAGCSGIFIVYDSTRFTTFQNVKQKWFVEVQDFVEKNIPIMIVGNKSDLEDIRKVKTEDLKKLQEEIGAISSIETSAKTGENVADMFKELGSFLVKIKHAPG
ncbi:MAG: Rab family GTPase [Candidatus Helarchaeota archaeon]